MHLQAFGLKDCMYIVAATVTKEKCSTRPGPSKVTKLVAFVAKTMPMASVDPVSTPVSTLVGCNCELIFMFLHGYVY